MCVRMRWHKIVGASETIEMRVDFSLIKKVLTYNFWIAHLVMETHALVHHRRGFGCILGGVGTKDVKCTWVKYCTVSLGPSLRVNLVPLRLTNHIEQLSMGNLLHDGLVVV